MSSSARRVTKNTILMYFRMAFLMVVSFFASRLLLSTLGVEDFGLYSLVGSIAIAFNSLKALFSESVQRYLNYEKGIGSLEGQISVFVISIIIHFLLILLFIALVEPIGLWLIHHKFDIPNNRVDTACFVFQMSVIGMSIGIISIPFDAVVIANEKMGIFALISIIDACLRLFAVLSLTVIPFDLLKSYSLLLIIPPVFTIIFLVLYCRRFPECVLKGRFDKSLFKGLFSLSAWNFIGNISFSLIHEGINMLLNVFGGLTYNAARAVAYQVRSAANQFASNTVVAVRPVIMQKAAVNNENELFGKIIIVSRFSLFAVFVIVAPIMLFTNQILSVWLTQVPDSSVVFVRLVLFGIIIRSVHEPLNILYMSYAKIKRMMIIESMTMLIFLLFIYLVLRMGAPLWYPFFFMVMMEGIIIISLVVNAHYELHVTIGKYIKQVVLPCVLFLSISFCLCMLSKTIHDHISIIPLFFWILILIGICSVLVLLMMSGSERQVIINILNKKNNEY